MSITGVEHLGVVVKDAEEMAKWYAANLNFILLSSFSTEKGYAAFIKCPESGLIIELLSLDGQASIEESLDHPLKLHLAVKSDAPEQDIQLLVDAGAEFEIDCNPPKKEDTVCVLKDPWGNRIQLVQRDDNFYHG